MEWFESIFKPNQSDIFSGRNFSLYIFKRTLNTVHLKVCSEYDGFVRCSLFALSYQKIIKQWRCYHYHLRRWPVSLAKSSLCRDNILFSRDMSIRVVIFWAHHKSVWVFSGEVQVKLRTLRYASDSLFRMASLCSPWTFSLVNQLQSNNCL